MNIVERLTLRQNEPFSRLTSVDVKELLAKIKLLQAALALARKAILSESAEDEQIALNDIDQILAGVPEQSATETKA